MRRLILTLAASLAVLAGPAQATVIANLNLSNGSFMYNDAGGLTNSNLPGIPGGYFATLSSDYGLTMNAPAVDNPAHYYLDVNIDYVLNNNADNFSQIFDLGVLTLADIKDSADGFIGECLDYDLNGDDSSGNFTVGLKTNGCQDTNEISGSGSGSIDSGSAMLRTVPEPGAIALLGLGLLSMGFVVRRRGLAS